MSRNEYNLSDNTKDCLSQFGSQLQKLLAIPNAPLFITIEECARILSLGLTKTRELVAESGALVKFGRSARVNREMFLTYIYEKYVEKASA